MAPSFNIPLTATATKVFIIENNRSSARFVYLLNGTPLGQIVTKQPSQFSKLFLQLTRIPFRYYFYFIFFRFSLISIRAGLTL